MNMILIEKSKNAREKERENEGGEETEGEKG